MTAAMTSGIQSLLMSHAQQKVDALKADPGKFEGFLRLFGSVGLDLDKDTYGVLTRLMFEDVEHSSQMGDLFGLLVESNTPFAAFNMSGGWVASLIDQLKQAWAERHDFTNLYQYQEHPNAQGFGSVGHGNDYESGAGGMSM